MVEQEIMTKSGKLDLGCWDPASVEWDRGLRWPGGVVDGIRKSKKRGLTEPIAPFSVRCGCTPLVHHRRWSWYGRHLRDTGYIHTSKHLQCWSTSCGSDSLLFV
jgi:hypothetical protein